MPRWNDKGANGKGDTNRSLSKAYNNGYDDIDWSKPKKHKKTKIGIGYKCMTCERSVYTPKTYGTNICNCGAVFIDNIGYDTVRYCMNPENAMELYE
jgi:hypothetical protein